MGGWELAVDLGTTTSAGAIRAAGSEAEVLDIEDARTVPSIVVWQGGELVAGRQAERLSARYPKAAVHDPKRKVGGSPFLLTDESGDPRPVSVARALGAILALFTEEGTRRHNGSAPDRLLLTHPARWNSAQCEVLREAAAAVLPGVPVALVPEPVAAAFHHAEAGTVRAGDAMGVYDLGGGTFDTAVVRVGDGVLGRPDGDATIGGGAFDQLVFGHFGQLLAVEAPEWWERVRTGQAPRDLREVLTAARAAKERLSRHGSASEYIRGADLDVTIDLATFEDLVALPLSETVRIMDRTVESAGVHLSAIVLTGGAARTPMVARLLRERYGDDVVHTRADPKLAPVLGAFAWADASAPRKKASDEPGSTTSGERASGQGASGQEIHEEGLGAEGTSAEGTSTAGTSTAGTSAAGTSAAGTSAAGIATAGVAKRAAAVTSATARRAADTARKAAAATTATAKAAATTASARAAATTATARAASTTTARKAAATAKKAVAATKELRDRTTAARLPTRCLHILRVNRALTLRNKQAHGPAFHPDGSLVAAGGNDGKARVWDPASGNLVHTLSHSKEVKDVVFSPDGRSLATVSDDRTVRLWDTATGRPLHTLLGHNGWINVVAFSPDGRLLATAGGGDHAMRLWDADTGELRHALTGRSERFGYTGHLAYAVFAPDGGLLVTSGGGDNERLRLWDPATGKQVRTLPSSNTQMKPVFSPDGRVLAVGDDDSVRLCDPAGGEPLHHLTGHRNWVMSTVFSPDGALVVTASADRSVRVWEAATGQLRHTLTGHQSWAHTSAFSPDGNLLATSGGDHVVLLWDPSTGRKLGTLTGHAGWVHRLAFDPTGRFLATAADDNTVRIWG